jgi:hypothetical protein
MFIAPGYTMTPTPAINGVLTPFTTAPFPTETGLATTLGGANEAYFAYDTTNLYFALNSSYTPAVTTFVTIYVGDGVTGNGGTTTGLVPDGSPALPAGLDAKYAFTWETTNPAGAVTSFVFNLGTGVWVATPFTVNVGFVSGAIVDFSVPLSAIGGITTPATLGAVVTGVGTSALATEGWPAGGGIYGKYVAGNLADCRDPNTFILP